MEAFGSSWFWRRNTATTEWRQRRDDYRLHLLSEQGRTKATTDTYLYLVGVFVKWCDRERVSLSRASKKHLLRYYAESLADRARSTAVGRILALRSFYRFLCKEGIVATNPLLALRTPKKEKRLWARSCLWDKAPELVVEKWLSEQPETKGKYVLIEFWATWCGPCRRSILVLNEFHRKFKGELVVIGISDEPEADVRRLEDPLVEYYSAIDTQARTKKGLGVFGIPHVVLLEPDGYVVWEGFPLLRDYELTAEIVEQVLSVGRDKQRADSSDGG